MTALATDPVIRTNDDALRYLTQTQRMKIKALRSGPAILNSWLGKYGNLKLSQLLDMIGDDFVRRAAKVAAVTGIQHTVADHPDIFEAKTLEDVNLVMAAELAAKMPIAAIRDTAVRLGANPAASEQNLRAVCMVWYAEWANSHGLLLDDWIEHYKNNPDAKPSDLTGRALTGQVTQQVTGSQGESHGLKLLLRHPLKWLRRVFVTEPGKALQRLGQNILNADKNAPWLSQFFLKPLGFHAQATLLRETGRALVDGSISTFDEGALIESTAGTLTAAGQALLVAAPLLPPPWNVAAAALGALSVAAGNMIHKFHGAPEQQRQAEREAKAKSAALTGAARQQHDLSVEALGKVKAGEYKAAWFQSGAAYYYGLWVYNSAGQPVPAWIWQTDKGWVWTGLYT